MNQQTTISEAVSEYLPERLRFRCSDAAFGAGAVAALALFVFAVANLGSSRVWIFGLSLSLPLSIQWLLAFVLGGVASLRFKHVYQTRLARMAAERDQLLRDRRFTGASSPTVLAPPLRAVAGQRRFSEHGVGAAAGPSASRPAYSQRVG